MKKLLFLGLATILFVSCQQNYSRTGPEVDIVKELIDDYHNGNWESWVSKYADTAKIHHNVPEGKGVTAAQQRDNFKALLEPLSSYKFDDDIWYEQVITDEGETWVNVWGEWHGVIAANNKEIIVPVHLTAQVEDGLVRKEFVYYDPSELQDTLDALAAAAAESSEEEHAEGNED